MTSLKHERTRLFSWFDTSVLTPASPLAARIYADERLTICQRTDRLFGWLMLAQWLASIVVALVVSPLSWAGRESFVHPHVVMVVVFGSLITIFPVYLAFRHSGELITRLVMAVCQMIYSGMFIHLTGGRIETHFHIFGSLAFLSFYRDWRVLVLASAVTMLDHLFRGIYIPETIYGTVIASPWRSIEHIWWVVFEDLFLISADYQSLGTMMTSANKQAELDSTRVRVEELVVQRTSQLQASETLYKVLCETAPLGIYQATADGKCIYINSRLAEIVNLPFERALGDGWSDVVSPEHKDMVATAWLNAVNGDGKFDMRLKLAGDSPRWVHSQANRVVDASGNASYVGTMEDITAAVMEEQARKEREMVQARLAAIVEHSNDPIVAQTLDGLIVSWNPAAELLFGWSSDEMVGQTNSRCVPLNKVDEDVEIFKRAVDGQKVDDFETIRLCKDGRTVDVALTCSLILDKSENPVGMSVIYRDISQRKEVEKRLSEFYSTISHELRTPLTSIRGALGLIDDEIVEMGSDECMEMIRVARSSSERLVRLINDILDIKKIEAGKLELRLEKIDAGALVSRAVSSMDAMARGVDIHLIVDGAASATIEVDPDRILQVLTNLISNAIKFSPRGKSVSVGLESRPDGTLRFSVIDHGAGIPAHLQTRLFQRFQQVDSSDTRPKEGTGLGLALSKAIVEEHGGRIGLYSSEATGSTFWFDLPTVDKPHNIHEPAPIGSTILLVEDDDNLAHFLRLFLRKEGYQINRVSSKAEAIAAIQEFIPGLILLDLNLPDGNGLDILHYLKEHYPECNVPVIVTTGTDLEKASLAHPVVIDCFLKPLEMSSLLNAVERNITRTRTRRVLLVEDDDAARTVIARQLQSIGAICMEAANGLEALGLVETFKPDLIILDVDLPKLNGFEVINILQKGPFAYVSLLVYSAQELGENERRKLSLGLTRYLDKGRVTPQEFIESVQGLLNHLKKLQ